MGKWDGDTLCHPGYRIYLSCGHVPCIYQIHLLISGWTGLSSFCADRRIDSKPALPGLGFSSRSRTTSSSAWAEIPPYILPLSRGSLQARLYHTKESTLDHQPSSQSTESTPHEETRKSHALPTASDPDLPHLTPSQTVHMTQITSKPETKRIATAACTVHFSNARPWALLRKGQGTHKGDVFSVARIAGIMAAKKTPDLVPLCHPGIGITGVEVSVELEGPAGESADDHGCMKILATVSCFGRTGVEMEAMTAAMGAGLTVYDMLKAVDKGMIIGEVRLLEKVGGKSGHWRREE